MPNGSSETRATKGLATVAMLKVNFDSGRDHIAMFEPFVMDVVAHLERDDFDANEVGESLLDRHNLGIPVNTLQTLLGRLARRGFIRREGGRYFRDPSQLDADDLEYERERAEARQKRLADGLREAAHARGLESRNGNDHQPSHHWGNNRSRRCSAGYRAAGPSESHGCGMGLQSEAISAGRGRKHRREARTLDDRFMRLRTPHAALPAFAELAKCAGRAQHRPGTLPTSR